MLGWSVSAVTLITVAVGTVAPLLLGLSACERPLLWGLCGPLEAPCQGDSGPLAVGPFEPNLRPKPMTRPETKPKTKSETKHETEPETEIKTVTERETETQT